MAARYDITGVTGVFDFFKDLGDAGRVGAAEGLRDAAEVVVEKARFYCPKDTHALEKSIRAVFQAMQDGDRQEVAVTAGDSVAWYAIYVHENLDKWHDPPTQAKFLERAMRECQAQVEQIVKAKVFERMRFAVAGRRVMGRTVPTNPGRFGL